jgi:uncharacterized glyoxalase superfamily protein PhnB
MIKNRSAPHARVTPVLTVADVRAAVAWYGNAWGFVEHVRIGEGHRAQLGILGGDVAEIIVAEVRPGRRVPTDDARSHQIMLKVDDAKALAAKATALGAAISEPLKDYPYGERQVTVVDPFGHQWILTQTLADTDPTSWGGDTIVARK